MSTPSNCSAASCTTSGRRRCLGLWTGLLSLAVCAACGACGKHKVEAKFRLTSGPVMVFVDDVNERVDWPPARRYLWEDVSQELIRTESAKKIIPLETEESLRQTTPDFVKRTCREIGEMAGAEQVVWIEVQDFLADEEITDATNAAYWTVTVKVLNPAEKTARNRVRLWPDSPEGHYLSATMTGGAVLKARAKDAISRELTAKLAVNTARLFHDHEIDDYEKAQEAAAGGLK